MQTLVFIFKRTLAAIPVLIGVLVITFVLMRLLPGDPVAFLAQGPGIGPDEIEQMRVKLGLHRSLPEQLWIFVGDVLVGDLGTSLMTSRPVVDDLVERMPASMELSVLALVIALLISIPLGVASAIRSGSIIDHLARIIATAGVSLPTFVTGIILVLVFFYLLDWAPDPIGRIDIFLGEPERVTGLFVVDSLIEGDFEKLRSALGQLILPSLTMAIFVLAPLTRMTRASMLSALNSDFIRTADAAGLSKRKIYIDYALRNALIPVLTVLGLVFSFMLGANILVEKVFAWPGVGSYAFEAMSVSDYTAVQGFVLLMASTYVFLNLLVDVLYGLVDPRIQVE